MKENTVQDNREDIREAKKLVHIMHLWALRCYREKVAKVRATSLVNMTITIDGVTYSMGAEKFDKMMGHHDREGLK